MRFFSTVEDESRREKVPRAARYYLASPSNSNDTAQRRVRIKILEDVLQGRTDGGS